MDGGSMEAYFFEVFLALPDRAESHTVRGLGRYCHFHPTIVLLGKLHYTYRI